MRTLAALALVFVVLALLCSGCFIDAGPVSDVVVPLRGPGNATSCARPGGYYQGNFRGVRKSGTEFKVTVLGESSAWLACGSDYIRQDYEESFDDHSCTLEATRVCFLSGAVTGETTVTVVTLDGDSWVGTVEVYAKPLDTQPTEIWDVDLRPRY